MTDNAAGISCDAVLSGCGTYRYRLDRRLADASGAGKTDVGGDGDV